MAGEIIRIGYAIPTDIRARRVLRIRPPVVSLGKIIMFAASASRTERRRNRYWLFAKISIRCSKDALPVGGCNVGRDRKSTRLNSSHANNSYAVFCLKKKKLRQVHSSGASGRR